MRCVRYVCSLALGATLALAASPAPAQTCGSAPTNVLAASAICQTSVRITWTTPSGLVIPKVWRTETDDFVNPTLIHTGSIGGSSSILHSPPSANTLYYFWVGGDIINCNGVPTTQELPRSGPHPAGVFALGRFPAPTVTPLCFGVLVSWLPMWGNSETWVARSVSGSSYTVLETVSASAITYFDTDVMPGVSYGYGVTPRGVCGDSLTTFPTLTRAGPLAPVTMIGDAVNVGQTAFLEARNALDETLPPQSPAPAAYQWVRNGVPLSASGGILPSGASYLGATERVLRLLNVKLEDAGEYRLRLVGACPTLNGPSGYTEYTAVLSVRQTCRADFNQSGGLSTQDIFSFLNEWFAGCP